MADHLYAPGISTMPSQDASSSSLMLGKTLEPGRLIARTPSPTPSEAELLRKKGMGGIDWKNFRKYFSKKYIVNWIVISILIAISVLLAVFQDKIVKAVEPFGQKLKSSPGGFLVPVAILIVLSFPPLLGQEIIQVLCGAIWGAGWGFALVAAGTILGEIANFYTFRYCCRGRSEKLEKGKLEYGVFARVVREGGFTVILMARLSALPSHYTTIIFALCGTNFFVFLAAVIVSLAQPFSNVYFGVLARDEADNKSSNTEKVVNYVIIAVTIVITIVAMRYINYKVDKVKPTFIYERRKARQSQAQTEEIILPNSDIGFQMKMRSNSQGYGRL